MYTFWRGYASTVVSRFSVPALFCAALRHGRVVVNKGTEARAECKWHYNLRMQGLGCDEMPGKQTILLIPESIVSASGAALHKQRQCTATKTCVSHRSASHTELSRQCWLVPFVGHIRVNALKFPTRHLQINCNAMDSSK